MLRAFYVHATGFFERTLLSILVEIVPERLHFIFVTKKIQTRLLKLNDSYKIRRAYREFQSAE